MPNLLNQWFKGFFLKKVNVCSCNYVPHRLSYLITSVKGAGGGGGGGGLHRNSLEIDFIVVSDRGE